jgi:hypothetical protein
LLGRGEYLDQFARAHSAETWKDLTDTANWQQGVWDKLSDPDVTIHFNLEGTSDPMASVSRVAAGQPYSPVDWELYQIYSNPRFVSHIEWWNGSWPAESPF